MPPLMGDNFLLCVAQIGLAFAGFSGLILTLRQDPNQRWLPKEIAGIKFILEHSFATVLYALGPFPIYYWLKSEHQVWQVSNALVATFLGYQFINQVLRIRQVRKMGDQPAFPGALICFYMIPTAVLCIIELTRIRSGSLTWYGVGLLYLLIQAAIQFWVFLIYYTKIRLQPQNRMEAGVLKLPDTHVSLEQAEKKTEKMPEFQNRVPHKKQKAFRKNNR